MRGLSLLCEIWLLVRSNNCESSSSSSKRSHSDDKAHFHTCICEAVCIECMLFQFQQFKGITSMIFRKKTKKKQKQKQCIDSYKNKPSQQSLTTNEKCVVVSVSAETLPSVCIFLFCYVRDVSGHHLSRDQLPDRKHTKPPEVHAL